MAGQCGLGKGDQAALNGSYRHYKGAIYEVLGTAYHSETLQEMIVYRNKDGVLWTRPREMFLGPVCVEGREVPRFQKL